MPRNNFSPSCVHRQLIKETLPALGFGGGDIKAWQSRLRRKLRELTGYQNMPKRACPLKPRTLWRRDTALGRIEKLVFTSEPGADIPAYLCIPDKPLADPIPVFICLQGHSTGMHNSIAVAADDEITPIKPEGDRDFAIDCMKRGVAALCIEQRGFAERREQHIGEVGSHLTCHQAAMNALILGRTLMAERTYDVDRGIDLLIERGGFDLKRLGVMGNSGGGLISIAAAALLPRIRFVMPSCSFCTYRDSICNIYHCVDNYIPSILRYAEMADIAGLIAPKPLVIVAGRDDELFPLVGVRRAYTHLKKIYHASNSPSQCKLVIGNGGHDFYADQAWAAMLPYLKA